MGRIMGLGGRLKIVYRFTVHRFTSLKLEGEQVAGSKVQGSKLQDSKVATWPGVALRMALGPQHLLCKYLKMNLR